MKKTLIALLVLGSMAMGEDLLTTTFSVTSTQVGGWRAVDAAASQLTSSAWVLKQGANNLASKSASGGQLRPDWNVGDNATGWSLDFTVMNNASGALTLNEVAFDCFTFTGGNDYQTNVVQRTFDFALTVNGGEPLPISAVTIQSSIQHPQPHPNNGLVTFTLANGINLDAGNSVMMSLSVNRGATETQGCFVGLNQVTVSGTTSPVPEPTTGTLSLLALAGLAVRRRRK